MPSSHGVHFSEKSRAAIFRNRDYDSIPIRGVYKGITLAARLPTSCKQRKGDSKEFLVEIRKSRLASDGEWAWADKGALTISDEKWKTREGQYELLKIFFNKATGPSKIEQRRTHNQYRRSDNRAETARSWHVSRVALAVARILSAETNQEMHDCIANLSRKAASPSKGS